MPYSFCPLEPVFFLFCHLSVLAGPLQPGARTSSHAGSAMTGSTRAPSTRAASASAAKDPASESDKEESIPASDVESLFEYKESEKDEAEEEPDGEPDLRPHIEFLKPAVKDGEDKMALLTSPKDGLELLLPPGKEWKLSNVTTAGGNEETKLVCTSDQSVKKRYVYQAMKSSQAKPIGKALKGLESAKEPDSYVPSGRKTIKQPPTPERSTRPVPKPLPEAKDAAKEEEPLERELEAIEKASNVKGDPDKKKAKTSDADPGDNDKSESKVKSGDSGDKAKEKTLKSDADTEKVKGKSGDGDSGDKKKEKSGDGGDKTKGKSSGSGANKDKAKDGDSMDVS